MRTKLRQRYYCDHCSKSGGSASAMTRHESACTANPNRVCKMCDARGLSQKPLAELISAAEVDQKSGPYEHENEPVKLLELAEGCPACMLAALRQSGIYLDFSFEEYKDRFWADHPREDRYEGVSAWSSSMED